MSLALQYILILGFHFLGMIFLVFWFNKKVKSDKDYFIAKGKLGPATIGFSFSATQTSGSIYMGAVVYSLFFQSFIYISATMVAIKPPAPILWIVTMSFSLMAASFTFPFLLGFWWSRTTKEGGISGMVGGAISCVLWYVLGCMKYQTFDNWIGGIWPAILGAFVSLILIIVVSKLTAPAPPK